jgi:hypothetical protein
MERIEQLSWFPKLFLQLQSNFCQLTLFATQEVIRFSRCQWSSQFQVLSKSIGTYHIRFYLPIRPTCDHNYE